MKQGTSPDLLVFAGRTYLTLKDPAAAEKVLRAAIDADPSRNEPYAMLGSIYVSQKRLDEAIREYEALSKKQAKPVGSLTMTGMLLEQQGNLDAAMKRYEDVLALDSRAAVAANNLAWLLADRGQDLEQGAPVGADGRRRVSREAGDPRYAWMGLLQERSTDACRPAISAVC